MQPAASTSDRLSLRAIIEAARERARRRRLLMAGVVVVVGVAVALIASDGGGGSNSGGGPANPVGQSGRPGAPRPAIDVEAAQGVWHFPTLTAAGTFVADRTKLLVSAPAEISNSADARVSLGPDPRRAQVSVERPGEPTLVIQYGVAGFDGCEIPNLRTTTVGSEPALISSDKLSGSSGTYSALIWPATRQAPVGNYGMSGEFTPHQLLVMAKTMPPNVSPPPDPSKAGC